MSSPTAGTSAITPSKRMDSNLIGDQAETNGDAKRKNSISNDEVATKPKSLARVLRLSGSKSPEKCPICLNIPDDRSYTDSCYHEFCFVCLVEWSKVKA